MPFLNVLYLPFQKNETPESWHNWLLSNWSRMLSWKRPEIVPNCSKVLYVQKIYLKMHPLSCTNTDHDFTDLVNDRMVKKSKTWISWERNITFLRNKKIHKGYFCYKTITSQNLPFEVAVKNFLFHRKIMFRSRYIQVFVSLTIAWFTKSVTSWSALLHSTGFIFEYIFWTIPH